MKLLIDLEEFAKRVGKHPTTVRYYMDKGIIKGARYATMEERLERNPKAKRLLLLPEEEIEKVLKYVPRRKKR